MFDDGGGSALSSCAVSRLAGDPKSAAAAACGSDCMHAHSPALHNTQHKYTLLTSSALALRALPSSKLSAGSRAAPAEPKSIVRRCEISAGASGRPALARTGLNRRTRRSEGVAVCGAIAPARVARNMFVFFSIKESVSVGGVLRWRSSKAKRWWVPLDLLTFGSR